MGGDGFREGYVTKMPPKRRILSKVQKTKGYETKIIYIFQNSINNSTSKIV